MRVLLIEDDPALGMFYSRALHRSGYEVVLRERGDDGLQLAISQEFEVIVLDWSLPGMDGISILKTLLARGYAGRMLMLSGSGTEARIEAEKAGADAFLSKPCGLEELAKCVKELTNGALAGKLAMHAA